VSETLYVLEPGSYLKREADTLKVVHEGKVTAEIGTSGLNKLILVGYVSLSGGVLDYLIRNRIETVFLTPTGRFRARLAIDEHKHVQRRRDQYLRLSDPKTALRIAASIVFGKIENGIRLLLLRARQYQNDRLRQSAARMRAIQSSTDAVQDMDQLRGLEGTASNVYFGCFADMIQNERFTFKERNRRPPRDPVNALLSFVYTLLTNEVLSAIKTVGLDPYLGALHEIDYGRPSLACDLVEEYRSFLGERLVLGLINRRLIRPEDFVYRNPETKTYVDEEDMAEHRPVEMKPALQRTFIAAYEEMMNRRIWYPALEKHISYRWLILQQVRRFAEALETAEGTYRPFVWEK